MALMIVIIFFFFIFFGLMAEFKVIRKAFDNKYNFFKKYIPYIVFFKLILITNGLLTFVFFNLIKGEKSWSHMSDQWFNLPSYKYEGIALILALVLFMAGNYLQHK